MSWIQDNLLLVIAIFGVVWLFFLYKVFGAKHMWNPHRLKPTTIAWLVGGFAGIVVLYFFFRKDKDED